MSCLTPCEGYPVPALPCTACFCCTLLSLPCSWAVLICRTLFSSGLHIFWLSWPILPRGRELEDGRATLPMGLCWTVGCSRRMVGREWSGWGWSFLRVEGWRSQITQQFSQIDPRYSSAADWSDPSGRAVVPVLAGWMFILPVPGTWQD